MPAKPKKSCCVSRPRCGRCPIRMLAEGRLPTGYTVHRRQLVRAADPEPVPGRVVAGQLATKQAGKKQAKKTAKKAAKKRQRQLAKLAKQSKAA